MVLGERSTRLLIIAILSILTLTPNVAGQACQNAQLSVGLTAKNLTSPNYPNPYPSHTDCQWTITTSSPTAVVVLRLVDFSMDSSTDCTLEYVTIYNGASTLVNTIDSLCGVVASTQFTSTGSSMTVVFHSNWATTNRGFRFEYISREKSELCGSGTLVAHGNATQLTSPGYPYNYPGNITCQWTITADSAQDLVVINLLDLSLRSSRICLYDYLVVYDGNSANAHDIDTLCGGYSIRQFISTGPSLTVLFHADEARNLRGFALEYMSKDKSDLCPSSTIQAISREKYIISPGYPYNYKSNLQCQWTITADVNSHVIVLNFVDVYLEGSLNTCLFDYVTIYDGPNAHSAAIQTVCGQVSNTQFISTGSSATVKFRSNGNNNYKGFKIGYTSKLKSDSCTNSSLLATATGKYLTSPSYPYYYQHNMDCQWIITNASPFKVIVLEVLDFYLESTLSCIYDYVTLYDGYGKAYPIIATLCGTSTSRMYASTGSFMTVVFRSDSATNNKGFKFQYTSQDRSVVCSNASLTATASPNYLKSPGYPSNYPSNSECQWTITAFSSSQVIVVNIVDISMEGASSICSFDYITIYDGSSTFSNQIQRVCGTQDTTQFISSGPSMTVAFHSDSTTNLRGFKIEYTSQTKSAACSSGSSTLTASILSDYLKSPNYPGYYPSNMDCQWHLSTSSSSSHVVVLDLISFNLEGYGSACINDYVKIYDGPTIYSDQIAVLCGNQYYGRYESTGSYMTVAFHSDAGSNTHTGFKFSYQSQFKIDTDFISTGAIVAIVICSIGVPCLVVALIIIFRRRMAQSRLVGRVPVQGGGTTMPTMGYVVNPPQAVPYPGMQNPQIVTMGAPVNYPPPGYSYTVPAGAVPPGETPLLNDPK